MLKELENEVNANIPRIVGDFKVIRKIGTGSFGAVFLCNHLVTDSHVAIKNTYSSDRKEALKFNSLLQHEAVLLKQLDHPNIVKMYKVRKPVV